MALDTRGGLSSPRARLAPPTVALAVGLLAGGASGAASYAALSIIPDALRAPFFIVGVSVVPGLIFGALLVALTESAARRFRPLPALLVIAMTTLAWILAADATVLVVGSVETSSIGRWQMVFGGAAGGLVGSSISALGVAAAAPAFRRWAPFLQTIVVGTVAGTLLDVGGIQMNGPVWILFVVWQAAVAASVNGGLLVDRGGNAGKLAAANET